MVVKLGAASLRLSHQVAVCCSQPLPFFMVSFQGQIRPHAAGQELPVVADRSQVGWTPNIISAMPAFQAALGVVFEIEFSPYVMRVVAFDDAEVMCDVWWPHREAWGMARLVGDVTYYRLRRQYLEANARYIRTDALSEKELRFHRPDLPFAVAQRSGVSWYEPSWQECVFATKPALAVSAIYLARFGPRDTAKPAALLAADNGEWFTEAELLTKAKNLQTPFVGDVRLTEGVGIYPSGIEKRVPSYYLWGAKSRADAPSIALSHTVRVS